MISKLGLAVMIYGCALHTWHDIPTILISCLALFVGGVLLVTGDHIESALRKRWPNVKW